jgi:alkylated DNA repair dioxygenase AlkB
MSKSRLKNLSNLPTLGPGAKIGEGDTFIIYDLLPTAVEDAAESKPLSETIFDSLYKEVSWQKMYHAAGEVPRLVAVQGVVGPDGSKPVYRHPSDQSPPLLPFTPGVDLVKKAAEKVVGHQLNHVLIQLYRDGRDFISEHSDKTLDIVHGSKIVNASFGAQRTMRLRRKKKDTPQADDESAASDLPSQRETQRVHMPHNSLFVLGLETNRAWLHGINADKRIASERSVEELAYDGMRISLTFRDIGTFLSLDESLIWGQGAKGKTHEHASKVVVGDEAETENMIIAFGRENHQDEGWNWQEAYGQGFDVLHFRTS